MRNNPFRAARQSRPFSLMLAQRDVVTNQEPLIVERDGYRIEVKRNPFWNAATQTGAPFYVVSAFGNNQEEAIENLLASIAELKAALPAGNLKPFKIGERR